MKKMTDKFMEFIKDNECEGKCLHGSRPFPHTHKLYYLHDNIVEGNCACNKKLKYWITVFNRNFSNTEAGYLSDFSCENFLCDVGKRIYTPCKNTVLPPERSWLKIVYLD